MTATEPAPQTEGGPLDLAALAEMVGAVEAGAPWSSEPYGQLRVLAPTLAREVMRLQSQLNFLSRETETLRSEVEAESKAADEWMEESLRNLGRADRAEAERAALAARLAATEAERDRLRPLLRDIINAGLETRHGLMDCVDNSARAYQSAHLEGLIRQARAALAAQPGEGDA